MSKLYKNVVILDSGAGFFALLVAALAPEVPGAAQFQRMELLQSLAQQGRTVVMVLHDLAHAMQYSDAVGVFADGKLAAFAEPSQLYEQKIWEEVFQVKLCKALDGTSYIKPLERNVLFHAVAPVVSKTGLLQNKNAIADCTKRSCKQEKQSVPDGERPVVHIAIVCGFWQGASYSGAHPVFVLRKT